MADTVERNPVDGLPRIPQYIKRLPAGYKPFVMGMKRFMLNTIKEHNDSGRPIEVLFEKLKGVCLDGTFTYHFLDRNGNDIGRGVTGAWTVAMNFMLGDISMCVLGNLGTQKARLGTSCSVLITGTDKVVLEYKW